MPQRMIYHPMNGISTLNYSVSRFPSIISKDERCEMKEKTRHSTEPDKARNGISNGRF